MIQNENNFTDSEILALIKLILYVKFESEDTESLLYAGSDLFFGQTGNPSGMMGVMPYVTSASEVRASLRYRY
jgi:hypothetical protein